MKKNIFFFIHKGNIMADKTIYSMANESQTEVEPFVSKQWSYIIDSNSGVYQSSQVTLDTSSWSNSGKFVDWSEAYFTIPMVMVAYETDGPGSIAGWDAWDASWMVGIKNGHQQLVDSFSVDVQNSSVIQLTRFTNLYTTYRMLTSMSRDELSTIAPSIGFFPDTSDSFDFTGATASASGQGSENNLVWGFEKLYPNNFSNGATAGGANLFSTADVAAGAWTLTDALTEGSTANTPLYMVNTPIAPSIKTLGNVGLYNRIKFLSYNPALAPYSQLLTTTRVESILKNYYSTAAAGAIKVWRYIAKLRLKDLSSVFEQFGLVRGLYCRFILNINTCTATFTTTPVAAAGYRALSTAVTQASTNCTYGTCPFMLTSFEAGQPNSTLPAFTSGNTSITIKNGIASVDVAGTTVSHNAKQVRLYGPLIVLSPTAEEQYLSLNPTRKIVYRDIYQYSANAIGPGDNFNVLLSNGLVNTKSLCVVPIFSKTADGNGITISPLQSAFASEPGTTSPLVSLYNYNVVLAGVNVYQNNYLYDWESFITELNMINSVNGNLITGLASGLITEYDFSNTYRYYVTDLSRRVSAEDYVPKSLQILGYNYSSRMIDLYCFVEVEKSLVLNTSSGERLE